MCAGINSVAKASKGSWITLSEWSYSEGKQRYIPICVKTEFVDGEKIKADPVSVDWKTEGFYWYNNANNTPGECVDFIFHRCNN